VPLYDFVCEAGHVEERLCSAAAAAEPGPCRASVPLHVPPELGLPPSFARQPLVCGKSMQRRLSVPAPIFPGADRWRK